MELRGPAALPELLAAAGREKADRSAGRTLALAVLAGLIIAFGAVTAGVASHAVENTSISRLIAGLLFPFGLGVVVLTGAELFTGNALMVLAALDRTAASARVLRNWALVYCGNLLGALAVAAGCVFFGTLDHAGGALAVYTIRLAAAKCALPVPSGVVLGFFCNVLVCLGVVCAGTARDTFGKIAGAYLPVAFFVIGGFEHVVANMYYIPAGLLALRVPAYAQAAAAAGVDVTSLTLAGCLHNFLPVTLGNLLGGVAVGLLLRAGHRQGG
ncbi:MAG: formate/nitrite transporter family protein [Oscillospiraceae bacterium]|nr:formate/nitrite transporter family protein [Oscillospiraceae bacterium]